MFPGRSAARQWCVADPGSRAESSTKLGPGSAAQRCASRRVRGTHPIRLLPRRRRANRGRWPSVPAPCRSSPRASPTAGGAGGRAADRSPGWCKASAPARPRARR